MRTYLMGEHSKHASARKPDLFLTRLAFSTGVHWLTAYPGGVGLKIMEWKICHYCIYCTNSPAQVPTPPAPTMSCANSENVQQNANDHITSEQCGNNTPVNMEDTAATPARDAAGV